MTRNPIRAVLRSVAAILALLYGTSSLAESPQPTPAFPGQTKAPPPAKASPPLKVDTVMSGLPGAWSIAFLPKGDILVLQSQGTMRIIRADGTMSSFIGGVPVIKQIGANALHDVALDPDFARNRTLYFTYFAPLDGEPGGWFPLRQLYDDVWSVPLAQRRTMRIGIERLARARLSDDETTLEDVRVIGEGAERRVVMARDGTLMATGADRFWRYESKLDGMEQDFTAEPDIRRNFSAASSASAKTARFRRTTRGCRARPWMRRLSRTD
jgi:glucose/arabinose dehydrogenase